MHRFDSITSICLLIALLFHASLHAADDPAAAKFEEARVHLQKGRVDEALETYEELAKTFADKSRIAIGVSRCHESVGEWRKATDVLEAARKADDKNAPLWTRLAELQFAQGREADAQQSIELALKLQPDLPQARLVQADLWAATGKLKEADQEYQWFVKFYNKTQPEDPEVLLTVARGSAQYARWHSVPQIFDFVVNTLCVDALAKDKECWQAHYSAGSLLLEKYNRAEALPEFRKALAINPEAADVYAALGNVALQGHELTEAETFFKRALEINPRLIAAHLIDADLKLERIETAAALASLEAALAINPHDVRVLARIAACYLLEDGAVDAELDELFANLDHISEANVKQPSRFGKVLIEVATRNPHPGVFLAEVGEAMEGRWKFDLAQRCYRGAIQTMPQLSAPQTALGLLYMRVGKSEEARKIIDQAADADPYHVRVSNMRKVLKLLDGYETISTPHFVIRIDSAADRILGRYMAEFLEAEYAGLVKQFGFEPTTRTQFEVFNKGKGLSGHEWFSARMVGLPWIQTIGASTGVIVALTSPNATDKPFNWARVLKHEFIHILTLQQTNFNIPHWFTEALATVNEGYPRPAEWNRLLIERSRKKELMNLDNVNLGFIRPKTPDDWNMAYCQSELYAQFIVEKFGPEKISQMLDAYRQNLNTDKVIEKVFGIPKQEFEKQYLAYVETLVKTLRAELPEDTRKLSELEKAHRAKPDDPQASALYALRLFENGKRKLARELALKALEKNEGEPLAAVVMARLQMRADDTASAIDYLKPALDASHPNREVLELLAQLQLQKKDFKEAIRLYQIGSEHFPSSADWLQGLAVAYLQSKDTAKLKPVLEKLVEMDADDGVVPKKLAQLLLAEGNSEGAIRYGTIALQVDVTDSKTHEILAEAYGKLKQYPKAVDEWTVALEIAPKDIEVELNLTRALIAAGRKEDARKHAESVLKKSPENADAKKLVEELK